MSDKLRVAVVGAGRWSGSAHLPGFTRSPLCDVVMLCDLDRDLGEARAEEFEIPEFVTDFEKVLSRTDIDVVDIVTGVPAFAVVAFCLMSAKVSSPATL